MSSYQSRLLLFLFVLLQVMSDHQKQPCTEGFEQFDKLQRPVQELHCNQQYSTELMPVATCRPGGESLHVRIPVSEKMPRMPDVQQCWMALPVAFVTTLGHISE